MNHSSFNYVRTFRQRHALSEDELAFLINQRSHTFVSRIEVGRRAANLAGALALQVLFRQPPHQMFPGLYEAVEELVMQRAKEILDRLESKTDPRSNAKRKFLERLAWAEDSDEDV
jgi:DNA-binding XRE family transcriptional regulator